MKEALGIVLQAFVVMIGVVSGLFYIVVTVVAWSMGWPCSLFAFVATAIPTVVLIMWVWEEVAWWRFKKKNH